MAAGTCGERQPGEQRTRIAGTDAMRKTIRKRNFASKRVLGKFASPIA
jgi:hypothetical protein